MLNDAIAGLGGYASKSIARRVEGDRNVVSLSIGEPEFGPPPGVREALQRTISAGLPADLKRYETSLGSASLRDAIARYCARFWSWPVDPEKEILVTNGGAGALTAAILAASRPGDEILIGDPSYMLYGRLVTVLGRRPVAVVRAAGEGYRWDPSRLEAMITPNTAALIVNSPENPTGYVAGDDEMRSLVEVCGRKGMTLIHDEVYDQLCFDRPHRPAGLLGGLEHVIQVNSLSKKFGVPGLRMGWLIAGAKTTAIAARAQDYTTLAVAGMSERVAECLLRHDGVETWLQQVRDDIRDRVRLTVDRLGGIEGITFRNPVHGGMFAFPSVAGLAERLKLTRTDPAGDAVAKWLLEVAGVAVVPGSVYGREGDACVRLVLCPKHADLVIALDRIEHAVKAASFPA